MRKYAKDDLLRILLIAAIVLVGMAVFVLFFEKGLPWLGVVIRSIGVLLSPFIVAWAVAVITRPLTRVFVSKLHMPPSLAVLLIMLILFALIFAMVWLLISVIANVLSDLAYYTANLEKYGEDIFTYINSLYNRLELDPSALQNYISQAQSQVQKWASQGLDVVFDVAKATPGTVILILVIIVAIFYWCREEFRIRDVMISLLPQRIGGKARAIYDSISNVLGGYVRAQALLVLISLTICIIGFAAIGVESPLAMGLLAGVLDIIPILGPGTLIIPWAIWSLIIGKYGFGVGLLIIYAIISVTRYILEPKIVGDRVGLHPLVALAAIFIGMKLFGVVGLILGPIISAIAIAAIRTHRRQKRQNNPSPDEEKRPPDDIDNNKNKNIIIE